MTIWIRRAGLSAAALSIALVMAGCDGGGGSSLLRLFFGINGTGDCSSVVVQIDLSRAGAVIAKDLSTGALRCEPNSSLASTGCLFDFSQTGSLFTATIDQCTIPAVTNLFHCFFSDGRLADIRGYTTAECVCDVSGECNDIPDVCVSTSVDPTSCEDCGNNRDDDGDGLTDCEDPACMSDPLCMPTTLPSTSTSTTTTSSSTTTTTVSTTTSSTTTVTSTSTTTSTTVPFNLTCPLTFALDDAVTLGALQFSVDYSSAPGVIVGSGATPNQGGTVECAALVPSSVTSFNDTDATSNLTVGIIHLTGFTGPTDLAECTMRAQIDPVPADFSISVTDAADVNLVQLVPVPGVSVRIGTCVEDPSGSTSTTTSTTTTTTKVTISTTTTTTTTVPPALQELTFTLDDAVTVGALQFDVSYANATGVVATNNGAPDCTNLAAGALPAFNVDLVTKKLSLGFIALGGFTGPTAVASCRFDTQGAPAPAAGDFTITVLDAADTSLVTLSPFPSVSVSVAPAP